jgi:hypothetical protein
MAILKRRFPDIHSRLIHMNMVFPFEYQTCWSKEGEVNVLVDLPHGQKVAFYDEEPICYHIKSVLSSQDLGNNDLLICVGFGLGYVPLMALNTFDDQPGILILERFTEVFQLALSLVDLTELLEYKKVDICLGHDFVIDETILKYKDEFYSGVCRRITHVASRSIFGEKFAATEKDLDEKIRFLMGSWNTTRLYSEDILKNCIDNLTSLFRGITIEQIRGKFAGIPAVCVASGPSLEKDLPLLKEIQNKAVILACDSAVKPLVNEGIIPHMVFAVDYMKADFDKIRENLSELRDSILVYLMDANSLSVNGFLGEKRVAFLSPNPFLRGWLLPEFGFDFSLPGIVTSNSDAVVLTSILTGANPIILAGMDLAFSEGKDHVKGAVARSIKKTEDMILTQGVRGYPAISVPALVAGRIAIEKNIQGSSRKFIDSSLNGAFIKGTAIKSIRELKDTLFEKNIPVNHLLEQIDWTPPFAGEKVSKAFEIVEHSLSMIKKIALDNLLKVCRVMDERDHQKEAKITEKVKKLMSAHTDFKKTNQSILVMIQNIRYADQLNMDRNIINLNDKNIKTVAALNQKSLEILKKYYRSIYLVSRKLKRHITTKKQYASTADKLAFHLENTPEDWKTRLELARVHAREKAIWLAEKEYQGYLKENPIDISAVGELGELYMDHSLWCQAQDLIQSFAGIKLWLKK